MQDVPPKIFFYGKICCTFKIDSLQNIVILNDAFDSAPKINPLIIILTRKLDSTRFNRNTFLNR
jgi:hypothetical protein